MIPIQTSFLEGNQIANLCYSDSELQVLMYEYYEVHEFQIGVLQLPWWFQSQSTSRSVIWDSQINDRLECFAPAYADWLTCSWINSSSSQVGMRINTTAVLLRLELHAYLSRLLQYGIPVAKVVARATKKCSLRRCRYYSSSSWSSSSGSILCKLLVSEQASKW